jgi:hypothetical protein
MVTKRLLLKCCLYLLLSCSADTYIEEDIIEISIKNPINRSDENGFNELIQSIEIIPISEFQPKPLINPYKIFSAFEKLFVLDIYNSLLSVYDYQGNPLFVIESDPGPESPANLRDFFIEEDGNIIILSYGEILKYDAGGKFIFRKRFTYNSNEIDYVNPTQFTKSGNSYFLWGGTTGMESFRKPAYTLYRLDSSFRLKDKFLPTKRKLIESYRFQVAGDEVLISPLLGVDSIYAIKKGDVKPRYYVNFNKHKIPRNYFEGKNSGDLNYCSGIRNVISSNQHLYLVYSCGNMNYHAIYSRTSGNIISGRYAVSNYFFPFVIMSTYDNKFVAYTKPAWISELIQTGLVIPEFAKGLVDLTSNSDDPDEVIILLLHFKDF